MSCSKSEAGQRAGGSIPGLVVAGCLWPVAKRVDEPVRTAVDDCVRELAAQLVMFALEVVQSVGGGVAFGSDLVGIAEVALRAAAVRGQVSQRAVVELDRGL
jgi:hypothetical protein